jgi:hypothetical protein
MEVHVPQALADFAAANPDYLADEPDVADLVAKEPEKASFIIAEAERDADCVRAFLHRLVGRTPEGGVLEEFHIPIKLWHEMLLNLAAAVRIYRWERAGLTFHRQEELPSALTAIAKALASYTRRDAFPEVWRKRVSSLSHSRFVWVARDLLNAVITIEDTNEDQLAEVLAQFAWAHRNDLVQDIPRRDHHADQT